MKQLFKDIRFSIGTTFSRKKVYTNENKEFNSSENSIVEVEQARNGHQGNQKVTEISTSTEITKRSIFVIELTPVHI